MRFGFRDIVFVPGQRNLTGIVIGMRDGMEAGRFYRLAWLSAALSVVEMDWSEDDVVRANPVIETDYRAVQFPSMDMVAAERADFLKQQAQALNAAAKPWEREARLNLSLLKSTKRKR